MSHNRINHHEFLKIPDHWIPEKFAERRFLEEIGDLAPRTTNYHCADCDYYCTFLPLTAREISLEERPAAFLRIIYGNHISEVDKEHFVRRMLVYLKGGHFQLVHSIIKAAKLLEIHDTEIEAVAKSIRAL